MFISVGIGIYLFFQILIGVWVSRKVSSQEDYFLAGRSLGIVMASFSIFATWFGAETCIGAAGAIYDGGLSESRAEPFGYTICLILMSLLLASQLWKMDIVTLPDLFRKVFSPRVEKLAALILLPASLIWAGAQVRAFGQIISVVLPFDPSRAILAGAAFVILYTLFGGLMGDVIHDVCQGIILIAGLVVLLVVTFQHLGGVEKALLTIDPSKLNLFPATESVWSRIDSWMVPILGSMVAQELISRVMASRSPSTARRASLTAAFVYVCVGLVPVLLGLIGHSLVQNIVDRDQFLPTLAKTILPEFGFVIFAGALISAILSTVDSALLSASAFLSRNVFSKIANVGSDKRKLSYARFFIVVSGIAALCTALAADSIYQLIVLSSTLGTAGMLIVTLFAIWFPGHAKPSAAIATMVTGVIAPATAEYVLKLEAPFTFSIGLCLAVYLVTTFGEMGWSRLNRRLNRRELRPA